MHGVGVHAFHRVAGFAPAPELVVDAAVDDAVEAGARERLPIDFARREIADVVGGVAELLVGAHQLVERGGGYAAVHSVFHDGADQVVDIGIAVLRGGLLERCNEVGERAAFVVLLLLGLVVVAALVVEVALAFAAEDERLLDLHVDRQDGAFVGCQLAAGLRHCGFMCA